MSAAVIAKVELTEDNVSGAALKSKLPEELGIFKLKAIASMMRCFSYWTEAATYTVCKKYIGSVKVKALLIQIKELT